MKNIKQLLFLAALGLTVGGCNKLVNGYDINPNSPLDAPADQQLTSVELSEGFFLSGQVPRLTGIWTDYFTGADRQYAGLELYNTAAGDYDNAWSAAYTTTLAQARIVETKAQAVNNLRLLGIGQVLEAQIVGTITALWGDVPYAEALNDTPGKFDPQASVYAAIQTLLDQAIANLPKNGVSPGTRDIFYGGTVSKWVAAAHSLKARYYLHVKNYAQAASEARLGIASAADDMLMPYNAATANGKDANPYYDFIASSRYGYLSAESTGSNPAAGTYAYQLYTTRANAKTSDTNRRNYYFTTKSGIYSVDPNIIDGAFTASSKGPMVTYFETQAILAEALARTGDPAGAIVALNALRTYDATTYPSGRYTAYVTTDFDAGGLLNQATGQTAAQALLKEILTEKYLGMVGQVEPFNDLRRTNNLIGIPKKNTSAVDFPQRLLYPQSEVNTNPNVPRPLPGLFVKTPVNS